MTAYEQYEEVSGFIKSHWLQTPVFMEDEVKAIKAPYIVVRTFGVANEYECTRVRRDIVGYSIYCYGPNRGRTQALISEVLDAFMYEKTPKGLLIYDPIHADFVNKLEDDLFEWIVTFSVVSTYERFNVAPLDSEKIKLKEG